jgi:hypothetical protein
MKKCEGKATYPGLVMYSSVETDDKGCDLAEDEAADHRIVVTNASTLTYEVKGHSVCDQGYLEYVDEDDPRDTWDTMFTAPWRWKAGARSSEDKARIAAKSGIRAMPDRQVDVEITCEAAGLSPIGPFKIPLQVDVENP